MPADDNIEYNEDVQYMMMVGPDPPSDYEPEIDEAESEEAMQEALAYDDYGGDYDDGEL